MSRSRPAAASTMLLAVLALGVAACAPDATTPAAAQPVETITTLPPQTTASPTTTSSTTTTSTSTTTTTIPTATLSGTVLTPEGAPLATATVTLGDTSVITDETGTYAIPDVPAGTVTVTRPAWEATELEWDGDVAPFDITLQPRIVRALRAIPEAAGDPAAFAALLEKAEGSAVNTIVFDTKDETGKVRYPTEVAKAAELDALDPAYDPAAAIATVHERGLYAITRVVTFEDKVWARNDPAAKLAGWWVDPTNPDNWEYPLDLATEACGLGFDEIQFDYVRFPAGRTAEVADTPNTADERVATIAAFLEEARTRLHPMGCAVSADIFAIVVSSPTDEGIGQRPEELSAIVDAISPMVYPSHYSPGWLGFADPNDHPGPVTADAIEDALPRLAAHTLLRPWLQAFYYNASQVRAGIDAAEQRGVGWMLWNAAGNYNADALPADDG